MSIYIIQFTHKYAHIVCIYTCSKNVGESDSDTHKKAHLPFMTLLLICLELGINSLGYDGFNEFSDNFLKWCAQPHFIFEASHT